MTELISKVTDEADGSDTSAPTVELSDDVMRWGPVHETPEELAQMREFMVVAFGGLRVAESGEIDVVVDAAPEPQELPQA